MVSNLRPISLLPVPGKILEHVVHSQISQYIEENEILSIFQHGFRKERSTMSAVFQLVRHVNVKMDNGGTTVAVFIDFSKAFNSVQHDRLIGKMKEMSLSQRTVQWFQDYLSTRKQYTYVNGCDSDTVNVPYGVPQASVLGPLLYLLYANDIENVIQNSHVAMYADDTVIYSKNGDYSKGMVEVQTDLENLQEWCNRNGIYINVGKTKKMVFGSKRILNKLEDRVLLLEGEEIEPVNTYTYLGVIMDRQVNFELHAKSVIDKTAAKILQLRKLRRFVTKEAALMVYKNMVLPILEYANILMNSLKAETKKKLQVLQNKALRCVLQKDNQCDVYELHREAKLNKLKHRREKQLLLFLFPMVQKAQLQIRKSSVRTRSHKKKNLKIKKPNTEIFRRSIAYMGPQVMEFTESGCAML